MVAFWLVSYLHPPFVLCLSLQVPPMQQVAATKCQTVAEWCLTVKVEKRKIDISGYSASAT